MDQHKARAQEHKQEKKPRAERGRHETHDKAGRSCPHCGAANLEEAAFCAECGAALEALPCPKCGEPTSPGADICVYCGAWILVGQCKFCSAPLPDGADFCPECGLPQAGIVCQKCGATSIFDFCSKCNHPLTDQARSLLAEAESDPELRAAMDTLKKPKLLEDEIARIDAELAASAAAEQAKAEGSPRDPGTGGANDDAAAATATDSGASAQAGGAGAQAAAGETESRTSRRRGMSTALKKELLGLSDSLAEDERKAEEARERKIADAAAEAAAQAAAEASRKRQAENAAQEEELRRRQEELKKRRLALATQKQAAEEEVRVVNTFLSFRAQRFTTNQSARRFHMAHKPISPIGWLCNYANVLHPCPEGPNACQCPNLGGYWVTDQ